MADQEDALELAGELNGDVTKREFLESLRTNPFVALVVEEDGNVKVFARHMRVEEVRRVLAEIRESNVT